MNLDSFEVAPVNGNILIVCLLIYLLIVLQKLACKCTIWVFIFYYLVATAMNGPCSEKVLWRNNSNGCFKIYWFPVKMLGIISLCSNLQFMKIKSFLVRPKNSPKQIKLIWLEIIFNLDFLLFFFFPTNSFCLMSSKCFHLCISDGTDHSFNNDVQSNQSNKIWFLPSRSFQFSSVQISRSVVSDSLQPHAACQASLSITNSWSLHKLMSIESVMPSNHLILCRPLLLLPSIFPSIRVFSKFTFSLCLFTWVMLLLLLSHFSCVRLCATPWTAAHQAPPSMGFSRQEYWSGLPLPSPYMSHSYVQKFLKNWMSINRFIHECFIRISYAV